MEKKNDNKNRELVWFGYIIRVNYTKKGGELFGFKNVTSTYQGTVNGDDLWNVVCEQGGFHKCKRTLGNVNSGNGAGSPSNEEILTKVDFKINQLLDLIDNEVSLGMEKGSQGAKVEIIKSDGTKTIISIQEQWKYNPKTDQLDIEFLINDIGQIIPN